MPSSLKETCSNPFNRRVLCLRKVWNGGKPEMINQRVVRERVDAWGKTFNKKDTRRKRFQWIQSTQTHPNRSYYPRDNWKPITNHLNNADTSKCEAPSLSKHRQFSIIVRGKFCVLKPWQNLHYCFEIILWLFVNFWKVEKDSSWRCGKEKK